MKKKYNCECLDCGHETESDEHCKDLECSECGGEMRRKERPGPGRRESTLLAVSVAGGWTPVGAQVDNNGVISQRFKKELIKVGKYEQGDGSGFEVTKQDLVNWVKISKKMHSDGVRIPVTAGPVPHEDVGNPKNSIGTMEDEFVEGDALVVILEIVGGENIENALANDVSIFSPVEFTDGKGRVYEQPITHVAITPTPLVPGLEGWEIAASLKTSAGKEKSMWKKIAKALGFDIGDWTDENGESKLMAAIKAMKEAHKKEIKEAKSKKASLEDEEVQELIKGEVDKQVETKTVEIKASLGQELKDADPMLVKLTADNRKMKLDGLISGARLTPDCRKKIDAKYGEATAIAASMKIGDNGDTFDFWTGLMAENDPIKLAEQSGAQVIAGALKKPDEIKDEDSPLLQDADRRVKAAQK